jgi:hypothetical protein
MDWISFCCLNASTAATQPGTYMPVTLADPSIACPFFCLQDIANQLRGGDMDIDFDQIFAKRAASDDSAFLWHQDAAYWPPLQSDTSALNCWLAVSNVTRDNGCLRYIPGSHKEAALRVHRPGEGQKEG